MTVKTPCIDEAALKQLLSHSLSPERERVVMAHLERCAACRARLEELAGTRVVPPAAPKMSAEDQARLEAAIRDLKQGFAEPSQPPREEFDVDAESSHEELGFLTPDPHGQSLGYLEHYRVDAILGRGGMGVVFAGFDLKLHRRVAIKMLAANLGISETFRKRFVREARAVASINHPNVVTVFSVAEVNHLPYMVMEYVDGGTLRDLLIRRGPLTMEEILFFSLQIARGLQASHACSVVHRDVKPSNILIERATRRPKLADFGLARPERGPSLTLDGAVMGTPEYMSPEQALGERVDERSDLYSLGRLMYVMAGGRPRRTKESTTDLVAELLDGRWLTNDEHFRFIPAALVPIIKKLLQPDPANRFQTAEEVVQALLAIREQEARTASFESPTMCPAPPPGPVPQAAEREFSTEVEPLDSGASPRSDVGGTPRISRSKSVAAGASIARRAWSQWHLGRAGVWAAIPAFVLLALAAAWWLSGRAGGSGRTEQAVERSDGRGDSKQTPAAVATGHPRSSESGAAADAANGRFVRITHSGERIAYARFAEAVGALLADDVLEIAGNEPVAATPVVVDKPITLKARPGDRPILQWTVDAVPRPQASSDGSASDAAAGARDASRGMARSLIVVRAPLTLEGLYVDAVRGDGAPVGATLLSLDGGTLRARDCVLRVDPQDPASACITVENARQVEIERSWLIGRTGIVDWNPLGGEVQCRNVLVTAATGIQFHTIGATAVRSLKMSQCTLLCDDAFELRADAAAAQSFGAEPLIRVSVEHSVMLASDALWLQHVAGSTGPQPRLLSWVRNVAAWEGRSNALFAGGMFVREVDDYGQTLRAGVPHLQAWRTFWHLDDGESIELPWVPPFAERTRFHELTLEQIGTLYRLTIIPRLRQANLSAGARVQDFVREWAGFVADDADDTEAESNDDRPTRPTQ